MARLVSREKLSKKARKKLATQQRVTWALSPVTRKVESKKLYNRNKKSHARRDDGHGILLYGGLFLCKAFAGQPCCQRVANRAGHGFLLVYPNFANAAREGQRVLIWCKIP